METLVLAGASVRALAQAAVRDGFAAIALDVFGDVDTRACARAWRPIGAPAGLRIDAAAWRDALDAVAGEGALGWIAGTGFEGRDDLLAEGEARLRLLGCDASCWAALRDPQRFFAALDELGLPHPPWQRERPDEPRGWLEKDLHSSGGWHVRPASARGTRRASREASGGRYFQRIAAGRSMSATLLARDGDVQLLGCNRQLTCALLGRPHVFRGVVGPVAVSPALQAAIGAAARALARRFGLRGLASLDLLVDGDAFTILELNPRPPASLALYPRAVAAHVAACRGEALPPRAASAPTAPTAPTVRGIAYVFAPRAATVDAGCAAALRADPFHHDLPAAGTRLGCGDPLCSVEAEAATPQACEALLDARARRAERLLEDSR